ncbi:hypothetical protein Q9233_010950 [Columba guinea]|nr:hypothetical protein Q9233_010950 [Columba guinea]
MNGLRALGGRAAATWVPICLLLLGLLLPAAAGGCELEAADVGGGRRGGRGGAAAPAAEPAAVVADPCSSLSPPCFTEEDRFSLEALRMIHKQMDDDKDGGIEVDESDEHQVTAKKRKEGCGLPEPVTPFQGSASPVTSREEKVSSPPIMVLNFGLWNVNFCRGTVVVLLESKLQLIAVNEHAFMISHLKIIDRSHRQKLQLKALDVVLFGPLTRPPHNWMKDFILTVSIVIGFGGCWFAYTQNRTSREHITKMMKDLESLQTAEQSLLDLQERLEKAQEENRNVAVEKQNLERKMMDEINDAKREAHRLRELREGAECELSRLKYAEEELVQVRMALKKAEKEFELRSNWSVPEALQKWLQLTHEVEVQYYNIKRQHAEMQLAIAKDEAEKIKKKRSTVFGTLHVAHSSSLDEVDHKILEAKKALSELTTCLRERLYRWQQIEKICGFQIAHNSGLPSLTSSLYSDHSWVVMPRVSIPPYPIAGGVDDLDEDTPPIVSQFHALYRTEEEEEAIYFSADKQWEAQETGSECDSLSSSTGRKQSPPASLEMYQALSPQKVSPEEFSLEESSTGDSSSLTADISRGSPDCVGMAETKSMIFSPASKVYNGILEKSCSMNQLSSGIPVPKPRHTSCSSASSDSKPSHEAASVPRISSIPQDLYQNGEKTKKPSKIKSLFKKKSK